MPLPGYSATKPGNGPVAGTGGLLDRLRLARDSEPFSDQAQGFIHFQRMRQRE